MVVEQHIVLNIQLNNATLQRQSVELTLLPSYARMGDPEDDVGEVGMVGDHGRERFNDRFKAFAWTQQAERQDHGPIAHIETLLEGFCVTEWYVGHAVWNDTDAFGRYAVDFREQHFRPCDHHHNRTTCRANTLHNFALFRRRFAQDGVQR